MPNPNPGITNSNGLFSVNFAHCHRSQVPEPRRHSLSTPTVYCSLPHCVWLGERHWKGPRVYPWTEGATGKTPRRLQGSAWIARTRHCRFPASIRLQLVERILQSLICPPAHSHYWPANSLIGTVATVFHTKNTYEFYLNVFRASQRRGAFILPTFAHLKFIFDILLWLFLF